jgi:hypothetical protein
LPLPNTRVFHPDWSSHHYAVAEGQMTAEGTVTRPGGTSVFSELLGYDVVPDPVLIYAGPLRVQRLPLTSAAVTVADRELVIRDYQVNLPLAVDGRNTPSIQINDIVAVTANDDDPDLIGKVLRVRDVRLGSLIWQRDLLCEDTAPTSR